MSNYVYEEPKYLSFHVTLVSAGGTKHYNGTPLTNPVISVTYGPVVGIYQEDENNIKYNMGIDVGEGCWKATGSQTAVGSSLNTIEVYHDKIKETLVDKYNYGISGKNIVHWNIDTSEGTLTVNSQPVVPEVPGPGD